MRFIRRYWGAKTGHRWYYIQALILTTFFFFTFFPVWKALVIHWAKHSEYSHGFLLVPAALFFALGKRERIMRVADNGSSIGLAVAVAALRADAPVEISRAEAINKSYPAFYNDLLELGAEITINK